MLFRSNSAANSQSLANAKVAPGVSPTGIWRSERSKVAISQGGQREAHSVYVHAGGHDLGRRLPVDQYQLDQETALVQGSKARQEQVRNAGPTGYHLDTRYHGGTGSAGGPRVWRANLFLQRL